MLLDNITVRIETDDDAQTYISHKRINKSIKIPFRINPTLEELIPKKLEGVRCLVKAMLDVFRGLKNLIKVSHIHIDSPIFRLHYSITVLMLTAFSLIVTTRQYVGNPIDCIHTKDIPEDVLNTYCWIHSTYTLKSAFKKKVGLEVPYPGVDNSHNNRNLEDRKTYGYYQWVCFCLFFQVILGKQNLFYVNSIRVIFSLRLSRSPFFFI